MALKIVSGSLSKVGVHLIGIGVAETGVMPAAFSAAKPSAIWSANSLRQSRLANCAASGISESALSALFRLMISLPHCTPLMSGLARIARPGTDSAAAVFALSSPI